MTKLTQERLKELLHYDPLTGDFTWRVATNNFVKVGNRAGSYTDKGYIGIQIDGRSHYAHRLAWLYETGEWPSHELDHDNRIKDDNRIANLRPATRSQNNANVGKQSNNTSGFKGVTWHKQKRKWQAQIGVNGKKIFLGRFDCRYEAHREYCEAATRLFGEFAHND